MSWERKTFTYICFLITVISCFFLWSIYFEWYRVKDYSLSIYKPTNYKPPMFGNCKEFYVDLGTNIGVQIRKLYEAEKYPDASILPLFDQYFGNSQARRNNLDLCAIGFEMNPGHTKRLKIGRAHV